MTTGMACDGRSPSIPRVKGQACVAVSSNLVLGLLHDALIDSHAAEKRRVGGDAVSGERGPKDGDQGPGDRVAEGRADGSGAVERYPVALGDAVPARHVKGDVAEALVQIEHLGRSCL